MNEDEGEGKKREGRMKIEKEEERRGERYRRMNREEREG